MFLSHGDPKRASWKDACRAGKLFLSSVEYREVYMMKKYKPDAVVAGPAFNEGDTHDYTPKGATGFGVRTLVQVLQDLA